MLLQRKKTSSLAKKSGKKAKKSKKKRSFNREKTRVEAINIIRSNSLAVSSLAGIEPSEIDATKIASKPSFEISDEGEDLEELSKEDDINIDIESFKSFWLSFVDETEPEYTKGGVPKSAIMNVIMEWLGTPYHFGGMTNRGIDCSAFVRYVYQESSNATLPRTAKEQFGFIKGKIKHKDLEFGDLVFFNTRKRVHISHVGIYLGDNLFAHSSSKYGVTVSSLESQYYSKRFLGGKRLTTFELEKLGSNLEAYNFSTQ